MTTDTDPGGGQTPLEPVGMMGAPFELVARMGRDASAAVLICTRLAPGRPAPLGANFVPPSPNNIQRMLRVSQVYGYWNASPKKAPA